MGCGAFLPSFQADDLRKGIVLEEDAGEGEKEALWSNWQGGTSEWQLMAYTASQEPGLSFGVDSDSYVRRNDSGALTTVSPVAVMLSQPLDFGMWNTVRPTARMGLGVVHQSRGDGDAMESEMRAMVKMGLGAEWTPTDWMLFRLGYEYSILPVGSELNPDLPEKDHNVSVGVEFKF